MTDDKADEPEDEGSLYEPESVHMIDGDLHIGDSVEFLERTNALACQWVAGRLYVLDRADLKWVNIEFCKRPMKSVQ